MTKKKTISAKLAKEMYDALNGMTAAVDEYAKEFIQHKGVCNWGIVNEAFMARSAACAAYEKATGTKPPKGKK